MPYVTVTGAGGRTLTLSYDTTANAQLAQQIANVISANMQAGTEVSAQDTLGLPPPTGGKRGQFDITHSGVTTLPHGYDDVVDAIPTPLSAVVFGSGDPNENILVGAANLTFHATGGSGVVVAGGGNNTITIPVTDTGNWEILTGNGNNTIVDLAGADTIGTGTGQNALTVGGGSYQIASVGNDTITAGSGPATIDASGASGSASELVFGGSGAIRFIGGAGGATLFGGSGSLTVTGGAGSLYVQGGSAGSNLITANAGSATLFGGGAGDVLTATGTSSQYLYAGSGNETLSGSGGPKVFHAGSGNDQIAGAAGNDTYYGASGHATVQPASASNFYAFVNHAAGGSMLVDSVTTAADVHISLSGYGANEAANALAGQTATASSVTISLSDNTTVTFVGITHLTSSNFG